MTRFSGVSIAFEHGASPIRRPHRHRPRNGGWPAKGLPARSVASIMTSPVVACSPETTEEAIRSVLCAGRIGSIVVAQDREPIGIVTKTDLLCMEDDDEATSWQSVHEEGSAHRVCGSIDGTRRGESLAGRRSLQSTHRYHK